jgi:hypothetical protein
MMKTYAKWIMVTTAVIVLTFAGAMQVPSIMTASAQNKTNTSGVADLPENVTRLTSSAATNFTAQKTAISTVDQLPGHQMHQVAIVVPQRTDGMIWVGTIHGLPANQWKLDCCMTMIPV